MYKVLLVDDERIIREGIASLVEWEKHGLVLSGTAANGVEAFDMVGRDRPDIIITDIKMPGLDGLGLIQKVKEALPGMQFVVLSGYGEFDFARKAMRFGVEHYLLKPCNEEKIVEVLKDITEKLRQNEKREAFAANLKKDLDKVMPQVKEQFLKDYVCARTYAQQESQYYKQLLKMDKDHLCLVILRPEGEYDFEKLFALKTIAEEVLGSEKEYIGTTVEKQVLLLLCNIEYNEIFTLLGRIKETFLQFFNMELTAAVSGMGNFENIPEMFRNAQECIKHAFYLEKGCVITSEDIKAENSHDTEVFNFAYENLETDIRSGNTERVSQKIHLFFDALVRLQCEIHLAKTYCTDLFMTIIRQSGAEQMMEYMKSAVKIQEAVTLKEISEYVMLTALDITQAYFKDYTQKQNNLINRVTACINSNIDNEDLTLTWIAQKILYMNEDYLGKLFKKETNENFSSYVTRMRVEKAKELINRTDADKIYEIAEKVGFGGKSGYFSQVFKKYTGTTPTEYKDSLSMRHKDNC